MLNCGGEWKLVCVRLYVCACVLFVLSTIVLTSVYVCVCACVRVVCVVWFDAQYLTLTTRVSVCVWCVCMCECDCCVCVCVLFGLMCSAQYLSLTTRKPSTPPASRLALAHPPQPRVRSLPLCLWRSPSATRSGPHMGTKPGTFSALTKRKLSARPASRWVRSHEQLSPSPSSPKHHTHTHTHAHTHIHTHTRITHGKL